MVSTIHIDYQIYKMTCIDPEAFRVGTEDGFCVLGFAA
jgi:hypothetical protein